MLLHAAKPLRALWLALLLCFASPAQDDQRFQVTFHTVPQGAQVYRWNDQAASRADDFYLGKSGEKILLEVPARDGNKLWKLYFVYGELAPGQEPELYSVTPHDLQKAGRYPPSTALTLPLSSRQWITYQLGHNWPWLAALAVFLPWLARRVLRRVPTPETTVISPWQLPRQLGPYELQSSLGRGGFAEVFRAVDDRGQTVALKLLKADFQDDETVKKRFLREVQILCALEHPHIVRVYDWGESHEGPYLVMEMLEGETLGTWLKRDGKLQLQQVEGLLPQLTDALMALHDRGLVHRDLKPDNVFVQKNGRLKLMDFGTTLANDLTRATRTGLAVGTPAYMAPEQIKGQLDPASDQYALGVLLFYMITGQRPFEADDAATLVFMHVHKNPPRPSSLHPTLPEAVDVVVLRMLEKVPQQRFPSVREAARALIVALQAPEQSLGDATIETEF